nr:interferon-induced protein 44-like [Oncorhynchus nerka]
MESTTPLSSMDVMGLQESSGKGVHKDDIINALKGHVKEGHKMEQCSAKLGVPVNCILPVKNYHEEIDLDDDMDVLLLRALRQMVDFADDFIKNIPLKITPQGN